MRTEPAEDIETTAPEPNSALRAPCGPFYDERLEMENGIGDRIGILLCGMVSCRALDLGARLAGTPFPRYLQQATKLGSGAIKA